MLANPGFWIPKSDFIRGFFKLDRSGVPRLVIDPSTEVPLEKLETDVTVVFIDTTLPAYGRPDDCVTAIPPKRNKLCIYFIVTQQLELLLLFRCSSLYPGLS